MLKVSRRDFLASSSALIGGSLFPEIARGQVSTVFDFRGRIPAGVTFRRNSAATFVNSAGLVQTVQANVPRYAGAPAAPRGLLIEASTTNHVLNSSRLDLPGWNIWPGVTYTALPDVVAPDGSKGVFQINRPEPVPNSLFDAQMWGIAHHEFGTGSVWLRTLEATGAWRIRLRDFATYTSSSALIEVGPAWKRYSVTAGWALSDTGAKRFSIMQNETPETTAPVALPSVVMWGAQYEMANDESTFVNTTGTAAQRAADEVTFSAQSMNMTAGRISVRVPDGGRKGGVLLDANGDNGGIRIEYSNSGWIMARVGQVQISGLVDVTAHPVVTLDWSLSGVQLRTGNETLSIQAAERRNPMPLNVGTTVRVGMTARGLRGLGRPIAAIYVGNDPAPIGTAVLPMFVPSTYKLSFSDDFSDSDVSRINENATGGRVGAPAWRSRYRQDRKTVINEEKQIYMDPQFAGTGPKALGVQPFSIQNGILRIRADRADPVNVSPFIWNYQYTSGCITSELTHWQTYGYFEMRCRMPRGKGFWPAFWLLPKRDAWPPEIDVFEGSGARPYSVHCGVIDRTRPASVTPPGVWIDGAVDVTDGFHAYAVEWTAQNIVIFVDGVKRWEYGAHGIHEDMYILANLAVGSADPNWIPNPDATTPFPGIFEIDYIRAYKR